MANSEWQFKPCTLLLSDRQVIKCYIVKNPYEFTFARNRYYFRKQNNLVVFLSQILKKNAMGDKSQVRIGNQ